MQKDKQIVESYDSEADTLYVSFDTGEPSYAEEIDDALVVEMGMSSHLPTGFRIINFSKHKEKEVLATVKKVIKQKFAFTNRWDNLLSRLRKAAEKFGFCKRDIPRLIADVRSRARA